MRVTGQKVLITGGATGIGFALARGLADKGNDVAICGRRQDKLDAAQERDGRLVALNADVTDLVGHDRLVESVVDRLGGLTMLINNAGIQIPFDAQDPGADFDAFEREVVTNMLAPIHLAWRAIPSLKQADQPAIVNVTSALAIFPKATAPAYCGSKAGLRGATRALRQQLAGSGIRVFEILPGQVQTETTWGTQPAKDYVAEVIRAMEADRWEIMPGKMKWLALADRVSPALARALVRRMAKRSARAIAEGRGKLPGAA